MILYSSRWLTRSCRLREQISALGLPDAEEARQKYRLTAHKAWKARQQHLSGFVQDYGGQMRSAAEQVSHGRNHRMEACRNAATLLKRSSPAPCKPWSDDIFLFTSRAVGVLAFLEEDTLEAILSRLVGGMHACILLDCSEDGHWTEKAAAAAESIEVSDSLLPSLAIACTDRLIHTCRGIGNLKPLSTAWYVTRTTSRFDKAHPSGK